MKTTTTRAFRRQYINSYTLADFDSFDEYFLYLHLNPHVQIAHAWGSCTGVLMFPWGIYSFVHDHQIWQFVLASLIYYGVGFGSHYTGDGVVSATGRSFFKSYRSVLMLIVDTLTGKVRQREAAFIARYPHMLWIYDLEAERPAEVEQAVPPTGMPEAVQA